ncbi:MAG: 4Fe-4S binding protein [Candidatus Heimdallarchaeota archaeon]
MDEVPPEDVKIGVFVCHCGENIGGVVDCKSVAQVVKSLPNVIVTRDYTYMCSKYGQELIRNAIKKKGVNRVVVAACSPAMHEKTFMKALEDAELNPWLLEIANIREQVSWVTKESDKATEKAEHIIRAAVEKSARLRPFEAKEIEIEQAVLVVGAGVTGIQAALDVAEAGHKVYLVERRPSIGGKMAQLDKTFPTLDCSSCILTPLMGEAADHQNIELFTLSEVKNVEGSIGKFEVTIARTPRYVDEEECTACGICARECNVEVLDEFNVGLSTRKAVYLPFAQAVPRVYVIDMKHCEDCGKCAEKCPRGAIHYEMQLEEITVTVGTIILATGYELYNPAKIVSYRHGVYPNIRTNLELERILYGMGPTGGKVVLENGETPNSITIINCVGSRDQNHKEYCSRYCCMSALKNVALLKEKLGEDLEVTVCFRDLRAFGKGFEEFYRTIRGMNVHFIRGTPSDIRQTPDGQLYFDVFDATLNKMLRIEPDMVVLQMALEPVPETEELSKIFGTPVGIDGFFSERHAKLGPVESVSSGIFIAGCCRGPVDIADSVSQASAAASKAIQLLDKKIVKQDWVVPHLNIELCSGCGACVDVCPFKAISQREDLKAELITAKCKGCGICTAECPTGALQLHHYEDDELVAQLRGLLQEAA